MFRHSHGHMRVFSWTYEGRMSTVLWDAMWWQSFLALEDLPSALDFMGTNISPKPSTKDINTLETRYDHISPKYHELGSIISSQSYGRLIQLGDVIIDTEG